MKSIKVLVLLNEPWNDKITPNNNMTNWFTGMENVEFVTISGSSILPSNNLCKDYFLIGENDIIKSWYSRKKAGRIYKLDKETVDSAPQEKEISYNNDIKKKYACDFVRLVRDIIWKFGRIDIDLLKEFLKETNPDVIFSIRYGRIKMTRLEGLVQRLANKPLVVYSGDDDYSLGQKSGDPFFWIRRYWQRHNLKKVIPLYKIFYSQSVKQMEEIEHDFHTKTKFLAKCGDFDENKIHKTVNNPIELVYGGKLYQGRYKTLGQIANSIKKINEEANSTLMRLNIYTRDLITEEQNILLNDGVNSIIHGPVTASQMKDILSKADVNLHVESFDEKPRLATKFSFSTKIMDCMESGCAIMAVCWDKQAGYEYLKEHDAAICARNEEEIYNKLYEISKNPDIILLYAQKAYECGIKNHSRSDIQKQIYDDLLKVIEEYKN